MYIMWLMSRLAGCGKVTDHSNALKDVKVTLRRALQMHVLRQCNFYHIGSLAKKNNNNIGPYKGKREKHGVF